MKKLVLFLFISFFIINCSSNEDDKMTSYKEFKTISMDLLGSWRPVNAKTKVTLTFTENPSFNPKIYITSSGKYFQGKPLYPENGSDGSFYFKLNGNDFYSKLNYRRITNTLYEFKLENSGGVDFNEEFIKQ